MMFTRARAVVLAVLCAVPLAFAASLVSSEDRQVPQIPENVVAALMNVATAWPDRAGELVPHVRRSFEATENLPARVYAGIDVLRLMNWQSAWEATQGKLDIGHCSAIKVYGTEFYLDAFRLLFEILGPPRYLRAGTPAAVLKSRLEGLYRGMLILTFGGGTNEMQRDLITMFSLGFPRAAR